MKVRDNRERTVKCTITTCTLYNALTGHYHDSRQCHTEDGVLPKAEQGETRGGFESTCLVLGKNAVILLSFILFIVEVLNRTTTGYDNGRPRRLYNLGRLRSTNIVKPLIERGQTSQQRTHQMYSRIHSVQNNLQKRTTSLQNGAHYLEVPL